MRKEGGVDKYIHCTADIYFPDDAKRCELCPCLSEHPRNQCRLTGEYIKDIRCVGIWCPLKDETKEEFDEAN